MAFLADNAAFISIDAVDKSSQCKSWKLEHNAEVHETTAGFGATYRTRAGGLKDTKLTVMRAYDDVNISVDILNQNAGTAYAIILGPEDNVAGKPKHAQSFILDGVSGIDRDVEGTPVVFEFTYSGNGDPTSNMFTGATF